jgi:two-component system, cell cycle sensor histidine kinase and response regulator CckA
LGILAGVIAHYFSKILLGILGNISLARLTVAGESAIYPILPDTEKAALRAQNLARQLLAFANKKWKAAGLKRGVPPNWQMVV